MGNEQVDFEPAFIWDANIANDAVSGIVDAATQAEENSAGSQLNICTITQIAHT